MGQRLTTFDFRADRPAGRPAKYPWPQWTDGSIWRIVRGVDFDVAPRSMQATLFARASRDGMRLATRQVIDDGREAVVFRFEHRAVSAEPHERVDAIGGW